MDVVTIAFAVGRAGQAAKLLYELIENSRRVRETLHSLTTEVKQFRNTCELVCTQLNALPIRPSMPAQTLEDERALARGIQQELDACCDAMDRLQEIVDRSEREAGVFRMRLARQFRLDLNRPDIQESRGQIQSCQMNLQVGLQLVTLKATFLAPRLANDALVQSLDEIRRTIESPGRRRINNAIAQAAESIVSSGESLYQGSLSGASRAGDSWGPQSNQRTTEWVEQVERPSLKDDSRSTTAVGSPLTHEGSGPFFGAAPVSVGDAQRARETQLATHDSADTSTIKNDYAPSEAGSHDSGLELTLDMADEMLQTGEQAYDAGDWATSDANLQALLKTLTEMPPKHKLKYDPPSLYFKVARCAFHVHDSGTAEKLLLDIIDHGSHTDKQAMNLCEAGSMLAQVYVKQGSLDNALVTAKNAYRGFRKHLRKEHRLCQESFALISRIYELQNDITRASAFKNMMLSELRDALQKQYATLCPLPSSDVAPGPGARERSIDCGRSVDLHSLQSTAASRAESSMHVAETPSPSGMPDLFSMRSLSIEHMSRGSMALKKLKMIREHSKIGIRVCAMAFTVDGRLRAASIEQDIITLWEVCGKAHPVLRTLRGHRGRIQATSFSPDGQMLASVANDGSARLWHLSDKQEPKKLDHGERVYAVTFSRGSNMVATGSADGIIRLWDAETGDFMIGGSCCDRVDCIAFSPNGNMLASRASDGMITVWDASTMISTRVFGERSPDRGFRDPSMNRLAFSPDGSFLASWGSDDTRLRLWDPKLGSISRETRYPKGRGIRDVIFIPGSQLLAVAASDEKLRFLDTGTGLKVQHLGSCVHALAVSSDGKLVATALRWEEGINVLSLVWA